MSLALGVESCIGASPSLRRLIGARRDGHLWPARAGDAPPVTSDPESGRLRGVLLAALVRSSRM